MEKLEKVIKGLELCTEITQDGCMMLCPYKDEQDETYSGFCEQVLKRDALELLKEQQEKIDGLLEDLATAIDDKDSALMMLKKQQQRIAELEEQAKESRELCKECASEAVLEQQAEIKRLKAEQPKWVSVSERLPEENISPITHDYTEVVCYTTFGDVRVYKFGEGHFFKGPGVMDHLVTHWQYLPKPPKEGEAE